MILYVSEHPSRVMGFEVLRLVPHHHNDLEPLAEVERALLVVEILHAPHPELLGLLLWLREHTAKVNVSKQRAQTTAKNIPDYWPSSRYECHHPKDNKWEDSTIPSFVVTVRCQ
jgi:hypothetical protein